MPNILTIILLYALGMFVLIYVFTVIPGKKKNKQVRAMHDAVKPGDEVVTIGGIVGTVVSREGDELVIGLDDKGGTLRLGAYPCVIRPGTTMERCYGTLEISERHRHRYEFNNDYREALTSAGLVLSGLSPVGRLVETVELTDQPFFVGVQYHPEFKSRPNHAHPLFKGFVQAALERENA